MQIYTEYIAFFYKKKYSNYMNTKKTIKTSNSFILIPFLLLCSIIATSCTSRPHEKALELKPYKMPSIEIMASSTKSATSLVQFFMDENNFANIEKVQRLANLYIEEGRLEGVNSDIAFVQMCLETGFLRFGGLVTEDMNNFCGLGAIDETQRGNTFETEQMGVRAHIQHLKAYGSAEPLNMPLVDPRYRWVNPKGKATTIHGLAGTWASDIQYGIKLEGLLSRLAWY